MPTKTRVKRPWETGHSTGPKYALSDNQSRGFDTAFYRRKQWRTVRSVVLQGEPICRHCHAKGKLTEATMVDHITPRSQGGADYDLSNLQPLCYKCHLSKTANDRTHHDHRRGGNAGR